ncbi:18065_t:CDS:2 [Funneliformis geosporum]|nr:18065_t:CDS:2 [Funneliformis geosporum]
MVLDINKLHELEYCHKNLHSGNILLEKSASFLTDFGLSGPANKSSNEVYGVLPYVAPEVLYGNSYTTAADIYSFGIIMIELSSGKPPHHDKKHDNNLAIAICNGLRPDFGKGTPEFYKDLAYRCMDANLDQRPTANELYDHLFVRGSPLSSPPPVNDEAIIDVNLDNGLRDLYIVSGVSLLFLQLNWIGSLYIFYRTFIKWRSSTCNAIPLSLRFPFYIAITDFGLAVPHTINIAYTMIYKRTLSSPTCEFFGGLMNTFLLLNLLMIGFIAITTWLRVVQEISFNFGKYDYKLWAIIIGIALTLDCVSFGEFGASKYWINSIENQVTLKIFRYILMFLLQYIPILIYCLGTLLQMDHILIHAISSTAINFGAIGNVIQYIKIEGWSFTSMSSLKSIITMTTSLLSKQNTPIFQAKKNNNSKKVDFKDDNIELHDIVDSFNINIASSDDD